MILVYILSYLCTGLIVIIISHLFIAIKDCRMHDEDRVFLPIVFGMLWPMTIIVALFLYAVVFPLSWFSMKTMEKVNFTVSLFKR